MRRPALNLEYYEDKELALQIVCYLTVIGPVDSTGVAHLLNLESLFGSLLGTISLPDIQTSILLLGDRFGYSQTMRGYIYIRS